MATINRMLDTFAAVGDKVGFGHVFTGVGADLGTLRQLTMSKQDQKIRKTPSPLSSDVISGAMSPSILSPAEIKLRKEEDERWCQVEGGSPLRWRSCRNCSFLCAQQDLKCEVCGTPAPLPKPDEEEDSKEDENQSNKEQDDYNSWDAGAPMCEVVVTDAVSTKADDKLKSCLPRTHFLNEVTVVSSVKKEPSEKKFDDENDDDNENEENEVIPGTLSECPPVGTLVKVMYEDNKWYEGRVTSKNGTFASVRYQSGLRTTVNVAEHAVRLADYVAPDDDWSDDDHSNEAEEKLANGCQDQAKESQSEHDTTEEEKPADNSSQDATDTKEDAEDEEEDEEEEEEDDNSDGEAPAGVLDEAPPVGTMVKVLFNDECWHPAQILTSNGTKAYLRYDDGDEEEVDFDENAIRPIDFVDEDEEQVADDEPITKASNQDAEPSSLSTTA